MEVIAPYACCERTVNVNRKKMLEEDHQDFSPCTKRPKLHNEAHPLDVEFAIDPSGNVQNVMARRRIVAYSSPAFEALCLKCPENKTININDVTVDAFEVMLNSVYGNAPGINNIGTACRTLLAANKYMLPRLLEKCIDYIATNFNVADACEVIEFSLQHELDGLLRECCIRIGPRAYDIFAHPSFPACTLRTLHVILGLHSLAVPSEVVVSDACVHWAKWRCLAEGREPSRENLRAVLGPATGKIRFLSMTACQLIKSTAFEWLLTDEEARAILVNIIKPRSCPLPSTICVDYRKRCS